MLKKDVDLSEHNSLRVPARAQLLLDADDAEVLQILREPALRDLPMCVMGAGSNLLWMHDPDGIVVRPRLLGREYREHGAVTELRVGAGEVWSDLVRETTARGFWGLENLALIPGWAGAAPIQNIGAYGVELADRLNWVEIFDRRSGTLQRLSRQQCALRYRHSVFKTDVASAWIVVRLSLSLRSDGRAHLDYPGLRNMLDTIGGDATSADDVAAAISALRRSKLPDPERIPNAGSFFHNPVVSARHLEVLLARFPGLPHWPQVDGQYKLSAAWIIEQCGWKGRRRGAVGVSEQHALVLVNHDGGTGLEVRALAEQIISDVRQAMQIELSIEPRQIGAYRAQTGAG